MADAVILKPRQQYILEVMKMWVPTADKVIGAIVGAVLGIATTLITQWYVAPHKTEVAKVSALMGTDELAHRLNLIEGHVNMIADYVAMQQAKIPGRPAVKAAPVAQPAKK